MDLKKSVNLSEIVLRIVFFSGFTISSSSSSFLGATTGVGSIATGAATSGVERGAGS